jgi:hypothetical protein
MNDLVQPGDVELVAAALGLAGTRPGRNGAICASTP